MNDPDITPKPKGLAGAKAQAEPIDTRAVRRLAEILNETDLTEIVVERGDLKIRVAREVRVAATVTAPLPLALPSAAPLQPATTGAAVSGETMRERRGEAVNSPMVGTVYLQAQPGQSPFVRVGDRVSEGQTLLIIEAMKTMNPIPARKAGVVREILVEDAQPVEYGEPLVVIE